MKLPVALQREPLVDAIFEIRTGDANLADILPGFLFLQFGQRPLLVRLPPADIPKPMRAQDPNLQYVPTQRLELQDYFIAIGDRTVSVSCKMPYPKWPGFKATIADIMRKIASINVVGAVERYSLKYINVLPGDGFAAQIAKIKLHVRLGDIEVKDQRLTLQVHHPEEDILHILSVLIGADVRLFDGREVSGAIVDVDSICAVNDMSFANFVEQIEHGLETLRQANKEKFFSCLTEKAIEEMGPVYE